MCLYPRIIRNPRYYEGNKERINPITKKKFSEECKDKRQLWVSIGCGMCIECKKQKAREWQVRLHEEIKANKYAYFITFTFSNEQLEKIYNEKKLEGVNEIATLAVRRFLERWRKKYKKSLKHWLITELGHTNTERLHLHGILFNDMPIDTNELKRIWKYGHIFIGDYCNAKTINYIVKYVTKIDPDHKDYNAIILASPGLGQSYIDNPLIKYKHRFKGKETNECYTLPNGAAINLPMYYRNKLWKAEERAELWTNILDKDKTYVRGIEINHVSNNGYSEYLKVLQQQQKENMQLGYGNITWKKHDYLIALHGLNKSPYKKN